jgi:hypothetical protein
MKSSRFSRETGGLRAVAPLAARSRGQFRSAASVLVVVASRMSGAARSDVAAKSISSAIRPRRTRVVFI